MRNIDAGIGLAVEEVATETACDTEMKLHLHLPDDLDSFQRDVADFTKVWNECFGKWLRRSTIASWDYETNLTDENERKVKISKDHHTTRVSQFSHWFSLSGAQTLETKTVEQKITVKVRMS